MDIRQLTYFIAVAETKNYSHAAKSLFVTQPTLSQSIKKIESELNTTLFTQSLPATVIDRGWGYFISSG